MPCVTKSLWRLAARDETTHVLFFQRSIPLHLGGSIGEVVCVRDIEGQFSVVSEGGFVHTGFIVSEDAKTGLKWGHIPPKPAEPEPEPENKLGPCGRVDECEGKGLKAHRFPGIVFKLKLHHKLNIDKAFVRVIYRGEFRYGIVAGCIGGNNGGLPKVILLDPTRETGKDLCLPLEYAKLLNKGIGSLSSVDLNGSVLRIGMGDKHVFGLIPSDPLLGVWRWSPTEAGAHDLSDPDIAEAYDMEQDSIRAEIKRKADRKAVRMAKKRRQGKASDAS